MPHSQQPLPEHVKPPKPHPLPTVPHHIDKRLRLGQAFTRKRSGARSGLRGKVVVITGAGAGIGRATAMRFAEEGAKIAAWDVPPRRRPQLESAIKWAGGEAHFQAVNVTSANEVESAAASVLERWDRIDVLINNAGIVRDAQLVKWNGGSPGIDHVGRDVGRGDQRQFEGRFSGTRAVVPHMIKGGGGVILVRSLGRGTSGKLRPDELRGVQSRRHRHDPDLGARTGQVQDPGKCRRSRIHRHRHGAGDARKSSCRPWSRARRWAGQALRKMWPTRMRGWRPIRPASFTER